jgi:hypothetical protein
LALAEKSEKRARYDITQSSGTDLFILKSRFEVKSLLLEKTEKMLHNIGQHQSAGVTHSPHLPKVEGLTLAAALRKEQKSM